MRVDIHPLALGFDHCYVIQGEGVIVIDGGAPGKANDFMKGIERVSIKPQEVRLIVLTHGHWDHIASAKEIKEATGAKIAMHQQEKDWLERPLRPPSPGPPGVTAWGRILIGIVAMFMPLVHIPATDVDIVLGDEEMYLADYGIPGRVIHTPGHSSGSVSVLLDTGDVFVGDLAMNKFPLRFSPGLPIFAEDLQKKRAGNCYWIKAQKRSTRRMGSLFQLISFGKFWCKEAPAKAPHALRFAEDYDATYREGLP